jgi:hypothetical protein
VIEFEKQRLTVDISTNVANYHVRSDLFAAIQTKDSKWTILPNGHLQITLAKANGNESDRGLKSPEATTDATSELGGADEGTDSSVTYRYSDWWNHPFHQRTYNSFVQIDWSRWQDEPEELGEGDYDDSDGEYPDLGPLSTATAADVGGTGATELPNESDNMFQNLLKNMNKNEGEGLPDLSALTKDFDLNKMQDMLKSLGSGDMTGLDGLKDIDLGKMGEVLQSLGADSETDEDTESNDEESDENTDEREDDIDGEPVSHGCKSECDNHTSVNDRTSLSTGGDAE